MTKNIFRNFNTVKDKKYMQIQSITYNYKTKLLNPVFKQNNVAEENQSPIVPDYRQESFITEISRKYAVTSPNFSPAQIKSSQIGC